MTVCFELSRDPALLEQYYRIREECFRRELGVRSFDGREDEDDRNSDIIIVRDGTRCIGGARLSGSTATAPALLPMERNGFMIHRIFPQIVREGRGYCQWTRLALLPEYRTTEMLRDMTAALIETARCCGYSYAFSISGLNRSRLYRRLYHTIGYNCDIVTDIEIPQEEGFKGLEHLLSIGYLDQPIGEAPKADLVANKIDRPAIPSSFTGDRICRVA